jgi:hypothetical protein
MTAVVTHKGGLFYVWYVSVYGYAPPATVDSNAARYLAWQQGLAKGLASQIPYGSIGPPGEFLPGAALLAPVLVTTPASPTPVVAPAATLVEPGVTLVAPFASPAAGGPAAGGPTAGAGTPAAAPTATWYAVKASRESLGGIGACRVIEPRGYSELSNNPSDLDFAALGKLPCLLGLYLRNPANGKEVGAVKQDVGAGSSFLPSMGLYPQTILDLGLDPLGGEFDIQIRRQDGAAMHIPRGTPVTVQGDTVTPTSGSASKSTMYNPLMHANVTAERIDQGVDYAGTGYLVAIADCVVTASVANGSGWEGEGYVEYRITQDGFLQGAYVYYAEGVDTVVSVGDNLKGGARVANLRQPMPHGIEIGFGAGTGQESYYAYHDGPYQENNEATRPGLAFSNLIKSLGGPKGIIEGAVVGNFPEYMPDGEPPANLRAGAGGSLGAAQGMTDTPGVVAAAFSWPGDYYNAVVQVQRGADNGSHHSHSAQQHIAGITYVTMAN